MLREVLLQAPLSSLHVAQPGVLLHPLALDKAVPSVASHLPLVLSDHTLPRPHPQLYSKGSRDQWTPSPAEARVTVNSARWHVPHRLLYNVHHCRL